MEFSKKTITSPPTTMMIRNIPNRYTQREFVRELDQLGFAGTYDFMCLAKAKKMKEFPFLFT